MEEISLKISGIPYGKKVVNKEAAEKWSIDIIEQTKHLSKMKEACFLDITFFLPKNKFPKDLPYGSDLDNLLKRFLDALNKTIFSEIEGKDSCVVELKAKKVSVNSDEKVGALLNAFPTNKKHPIIDCL